MLHTPKLLPPALPLAPLFPLAFSLALSAPAPAQCRYSITYIQGPPSYQSTVFRQGGLNDLSQIAVSFAFEGIGPDIPFAWAPDIPLTFLRNFPPGVYAASPADISNQPAFANFGLVVGTADQSNIGYRAFSHDGQFVSLLEVLPCANWSLARAVNTRGTIVGYSPNIVDACIYHACQWQNGRIHDIGADLPFQYSIAYDINDAGLVVGWVSAGLQESDRAFVWQPGVACVLPPVPGGINSTAVAVNNRGQVAVHGRVGALEPGNLLAPSDAFIWDNGSWIPLNSPFDACRVYDINDAAVVIGRTESLDSQQGMYFVWREGRFYDIRQMMIDPPNHVTRFDQSIAINNMGQILGTGRRFILLPFQALDLGYILLTPVPATPGDTNCDSQVNIDDLTDVILNWNNVGGGADLNFDQSVDVLDLAQVVENWSASK